jgi:hypothetical protein
MRALQVLIVEPRFRKISVNSFMYVLSSDSTRVGMSIDVDPICFSHMSAYDRAASLQPEFLDKLLLRGIFLVQVPAIQK